MKILIKIITLIIVMLTTFLLISENQKNTSVKSTININKGKKYNVAVIVYRTSDPYQMRLEESLENIERESENNVKFTFFDSKNNIAIQNEILDSSLRKDFDLLILNLADKRENIVEDVINRVKPKNIPLILVNISPEVVAKVSKLYSKVAFVIPDSKQAGTIQGKIIVDSWRHNKIYMDKNDDDILQYVLLQGPSGDTQVIDRSKYAISAINDSGVKTQLLESVRADWSKDLAKDSIGNLLFKYDGKIEAIISNNDAMAIGAIEALQKYGYNKGDKIKSTAVFGIDGLPEAINLIDKGFMTGTVIQDANVAAKTLYTVGINLINNLEPIEKTDYKTVAGEIIIPYPYNEYVGKTD